MGRIFGILFLVLAVWTGAEVYSEGTQNAFGGSLAFLGESGDGEEIQDRRTTPQRAGDAVREAHRDAEQRREGMLDN